jgi:hypothetical protein
MESVEIKTPLLRPKKYRKRKRTVEEFKVEEFKSFGSSNYFNEYDYCEIEDIPFNHNSSALTERSIESWLISRSIIKTPITAKKDDFFAESRQRVNSISYFENMAELDSTEISPINQSKGLTPPSLNLTPINSKIHKKRSNFTSMSAIKMPEIMDPAALPRNPSKFRNMKPLQVLSDQKVKNQKEEIKVFSISLLEPSKVASCLMNNSGL